MTLREKFIFSFLLILALVVLDQTTKTLATLNTSPICNSGFAFGLLQGFFNGFIAFVLILILLYSLWKVQKTLTFFALTFIVAGGISNLIDRFIDGCVVDFIDLGFWPSFNLADAAITIGSAILIFSLLKLWPLK